MCPNSALNVCNWEPPFCLTSLLSRVQKRTVTEIQLHTEICLQGWINGEADDAVNRGLRSFAWWGGPYTTCRKRVGLFGPSNVQWRRLRLYYFQKCAVNLALVLGPKCPLQWGGCEGVRARNLSRIQGMFSPSLSTLNVSCKPEFDSFPAGSERLRLAWSC